MNNTTLPAMSVIIVTLDNYQTIRKTIQSLALQTVKEQLEIIIVAPNIQELGLIESELKDFFQYQIIEVKQIEASGFARVAGVRQAKAPIVVFAEDHAYPDPTWAEILIEAHKKPWAAVAPGIVNGNPETLVSWVSYISGYFRWMDTEPAGVLNDLPWRNSSYKKSILMEYGEELEQMMLAESVMHWDLQRKGYQLYFESSAKVKHLNFTHLFPMLQESFYTGRLLAAARVQQWSLLRQLIYIGGSPLIPIVKLWRIFPILIKTGLKNNLLPQIIPVYLLALIVNTLGEILGFAFGFVNSEQEVNKIEFHKDRHVLVAKHQ